MVVFALFCVVHGGRRSRRSSGWSARLPGFSAAHNERLLIYFLLCLALLAGWGLDDLTQRCAAAARAAARCSPPPASIFCVPIVWLLAAGTPRACTSWARG